MVLAPDDLIDYVVQSLTFNGDEGATLSELWDFVRIEVPDLDDFQKQVIWGWLINEVKSGNVVVGIGNQGVLNASDYNKSLNELIELFGEETIRVYASEENLWVRLTGRPKIGNPIGPHPFQILCAVTRSRTRGMTSVEIAKETGQDPRSINGRVGLLIDQGLVQRYPIVSSGISTHLIVYKRFIKDNRESSFPRGNIGIDMNQLRIAIVSSVKNAKNGLREHEDLRMEVGMDKSHRLQIAFNKAVRRLEAAGFIKRVIVKVKDRPDERFRCVKFVQDLPPDADNASSSESDNDAFDDLDDDLEKEENDEKKKQPAGNHFSTEDLDAEDFLKVESDDVPEKGKYVLFNSCYPLENQVYNVVSFGGTFGMPAMDLCKILVGSTYSRIFSKYLDLLVDRQGKSSSAAKSSKKIKLNAPSHLEYLKVIRGIDFTARTKFYRYFTQVAYNEYTAKDPNDTWGTFIEPDLTNGAKSLKELEAKSQLSLPGLVGVLKEDDGTLIPLFHGEKGKTSADQLSNIVSLSNPPPRTPSTSTKKRGRPRKYPLPEDGNGERKKAKRGRPRKDKSDQQESLKDVEPGSQFSNQGIEQPRDQAKAVQQPEQQIDDEFSAIINQSALRELPRDEPLFSTKSRPNVTRDASDHNILSSERNFVKDSIALEAKGSDSLDIDPLIKVTKKPFDLSSPPPEDDVQITSTNSTDAQDSKGATESSDLSSARTTDNTQKEKIPDISFALIKRQSQFLQILKEDGGVTEGGVNLVKRFIEKFSHDQGSAIDRKTVYRCVEKLIMKGDIKKIYVGVPSEKNSPVRKYLLLDSKIDPDSIIVQEAKMKLVENSNNKKKAYVTPAKLDVVDSEFQYYFDQPKKEGKSANAIKSKKKALSRLAKSDRERANKTKESEEGERFAPIVRSLKEPPPVKRKSSLLSPETPSKRAKQRAEDYIEPENVQLQRKVNDQLFKSARAEMEKEIKDPLTVMTDAQQHKKLRVSSRSRSGTQTGAGESAETPVEKGRRARAKTMGKVDMEIFFRVVVIVRSIFSNTHGTISWDKVSQTLPDISPDVAKARWPKVRDQYGGVVQLYRTASRWEAIFLNGYEKGEIEMVNDPDLFDIHALALYWKAQEKTLQPQSCPWLYETKDDVHRQYSFVPEKPGDTLESVFSSPSMIRTDEIMSNYSFAFDTKRLDELTPNEIKSSEAMKAIKAIIATDNEEYDVDKSKEVLNRFGEQTCTEAINEMETQRSIIYLPKDREKLAPGRNFLFSEKFWGTFDNKWSDSVFSDASAFEKTLFSTFSSSRGMIMSRTASDTSLICILDLICHRALDLVRVNAATGALSMEGYKSRTVDKEKLDCDIVLRSKRDSSKELRAVDRPNIAVPLSSEPCGSIWTSINGNLNKKIWVKILNTVMLLIALRPGITVSSIWQKLKLVITTEELGIMLNWLHSRKCIMKGAYEGYWIEPQWYSNVL